MIVEVSIVVTRNLEAQCLIITIFEMELQSKKFGPQLRKKLIIHNEYFWELNKIINHATKF
jgi:hypothetical protein